MRIIRIQKLNSHYEIVWWEEEKKDEKYFVNEGMTNSRKQFTTPEHAVSYIKKSFGKAKTYQIIV